jgi:hypothetical protein
LRHLAGDDLKAAIQEEYHTQAIAFIVRQTDYGEDTAAERLNALNDPVEVIKEYLGMDKIAESHKPESATLKSTSKNQIKYGEIRKFMDAGAKQYNAQKEANEQRNKYQEHMQRLQQEKHNQEHQEAKHAK